MKIMDTTIVEFAQRRSPRTKRSRYSERTRFPHNECVVDTAAMFILLQKIAACTTVKCTNQFVT